MDKHDINKLHRHTTTRKPLTNINNGALESQITKAIGNNKSAEVECHSDKPRGSSAFTKEVQIPLITVFAQQRSH